MHDTSSEGAPSQAGTGTAVMTDRTVDGRGTVVLLRVVAVLALLQTLVQGLLAGMLLNGDLDSIDPHGHNAYAFEFLVFLQVVAAVLLWRRNRWLTWPLKATIGILAATFAQTGLGLNSALAAHVTLGVALCAMETALVLRAFTLRVAAPARS
ncbi:hypothetical protein [Streptomyces canus]|uniref:hypothetical protein n=1 Tax=Streptomyces canus TaxID=58343 RepID=UPI00277EE4BA|nr:hypothetical protein [Streptomyces canus]MDQ0757387.1 hypothetical protein [Streptomyces canus]MDQ1064681.1 hypothetical protein [Streptomyces canus]